MKIEKYKKLEEKIIGQNFNQSYKTINVVMTVLSYFGHVASIFLAYFMLSKVLSGAMTDSVTAVFIASIIILSGIELLKRDIFDKFSIQYLKTNTISKGVLPLFLLSVAIISISFYASISGAAEFSSKSKVLDTTKKEVLTTYKDSVSNSYNTKITLLEAKVESKDKEQTDLEALPATRQQKSRIKDLKKDKEDIKADITSLKEELKTNLVNKETEVSSETDEKKQDNSKNSLMFIIISTFIEITILAGVFFNEYYKFRSYREFRDKIEKDPGYQKWFLYERILSVIYTEDTKINQKLPANKSVIEMCKVNDVIVLPRDIMDFLKVLNGIGIIKVSGSSRYINKPRELAFEYLKKHFNIE
jgi:flagellar biosynthesis regulator FlaF